MRVWICTDMEGLAGVDSYAQCYPESKLSEAYQFARRQLTLEANATIEGCLDAGAEEIWVLDGHGLNAYEGFTSDLHPAAIKVPPLTPGEGYHGLDAKTDAVLVIGQHAMAGTLAAFLDHTESIEHIHRLRLNGEEAGEFAIIAHHAGAFGVPVVFASGDEAFCAEARRLIPGLITTPTKAAASWSVCDLYDPSHVRTIIRQDVHRALQLPFTEPLRRPLPLRMEVEYHLTKDADLAACRQGSTRLNARTLARDIFDLRDIHQFLF